MMLWSPAILLLLAGAAFARPQNAWENGKEYTYRVRSRTLSSFNPQSKQYAGVFMEARLTIQSNGQDLLRAKISNPKQSQVHTHLENGWESEIPRNQLNLQNLPLTGEPFEIRMKNGVVQDLIVDKDVPTWEVNMIKSIVSQLQVDTQGQNVERSQYNQLPEGDQPYAMFRAMEDSVGGECEVLYDISPASEQVVRNIPEAVPMPRLREDGEIISVVKTKNYSNCDQRVGFHYGLTGNNNWEPGNNENGKHLSRSSISRIFISGNLKKYTIQSSVTRNKIVLSPDQHENQQGMVASKMNLTLNEVKDISESMPAPSHPQSTGNLVYNYNIPSGSPSSRRQNKPKSDRNQQDGHKNQQDGHKNQQDGHKNQHHNRHSDESSNESSSSEFNEDRDSYLMPQPKLTEPPQYALLPYFVGYRGNAIHKSNQINIVASAKRIAQEIGDEFKSPDNMLEAQTLEKFLILSGLVRTMNVEQIAEVQQALYQKAASQNDINQRSEEEHTRRHIWIAFRDAVAQAGTGPALVNIKRWIQNQQIQGSEAANVVDTAGKSARTPNSEYLDAFFELVQMKELNQHQLKSAATYAFADLIRQAAVNKQSAHNRYPVHVFGRLISKNNRDVQEKYIPYLADKLKSAVESGDSTRIRVYTVALGKTGHPQILSVFEPYLEGRKQISNYQRLIMVSVLKYLTTVSPKIARSVLYKIYSNSNESYDIRTVAVYLLMHTNPPASMLQRMAENTNYDSNKHVNSAVKSVIESIAQLQSDESNDLLDGARAAVPLLTPERYGPQYSRAIFKSIKNYLTHSELDVEVQLVGSEDSVIPKLSTLILYPTYNGIKGTKIEFGGSVSSVENLFKFIHRQWYNSKSKNSPKAAQQKYSPENLATMLGINGETPEQVEGALYAKSRSAEELLVFDNHTLENIPQYLKHLKEELKKGLNVDRTRFGNSELIISFPTETGYPVIYSHNAPFVSSVHGKYQANYESSSDNQSSGPKSLAGSGKMRVVYGMKDQKRLGFVTPYEHQVYAAGVDKNLQVHLPLHSDIEYNKEKNEVRVKVQPHDNKEFRVIQFKTQPFTTKHDLTNLQPIANSEETHTIHKSQAVASHSLVTDEKKQQRLELNWEKLPNGQQEQHYSKNSAIDAAAGLARAVASALSFTHERTQYEKYSVKVYPSSDLNAELRVSCDSSISEENNGSDDSENNSPNAQPPRLEKSLGQQERKRKLLQEVSRNMNSAKAHAVDISLQLGSQSSFSLTTAMSQSNVDKKSRGMVYANGRGRDGEDYYLSAGYEGKHPNVWSMDYEDILKHNIPHEFDAKISVGKSNGDEKEQDKVRIQGEIRQSEDRKNSIRQSHEAQECNKQKNRNGNKMTSSCEAVNERASGRDSAQITVTFAKESHMKHSAMRALEAIEDLADSYVQTEKNSQNKADRNEIKIHARASPDDEKLNIAVKTSEGELKFNDISVTNKNRFYKNNEKRNDKLPYYQQVTESVCYLDKTEVKTFDHHEYPIELGQCWHVAVTSYPKNSPDSPTQKLEIPENMQFSVLVRDNENGQRDLKITLPNREIEIYEPEPRTPRVKINGREVELSHSKSIQEVENGERVFEIIKLKDNTVRFTSEKYEFELIYDGQRVKILVGQRYRNSVRGLCGNYNGEPSNDQQTPKGCHMEKPHEFAASYALVNERCAGPAQKYADKLKTAQCAYESVRPGNVISDEEAGRSSQKYSHQKDSNQEGSCMRYRTKVTMSDNEICFSVRPVASCSSKCSPVSPKSKSIQFHCVPRTSASEKVADRVRSGANPDLSQKTVSKTENYDVPQSCSA